MKTKFCNYLTKKHRTHGLVNHTIIINLYHKTSYFIVGLIRSLREILYCMAIRLKTPLN